MTREIHQDENMQDWLGKSAIKDLGPVIDGVQVWGSKTNQAFRRTLLSWFDQEKRDLPWRQTKDPYAIWVSEIMLQQTQVTTVIPYYARFLDRFPDVEALAEADDDLLLKTWEGLGYYQRVRNMKEAAQQVMDKFAGVFPDNYEDIHSLKGIGDYTAGAIASIAFDEVVPAVDGNAMRVFGRIFTINADISRAKTVKIYQSVVRYVMDPDRPGDFNQAIMDLGASYETARSPQPDKSPIRDYNLAYLSGREEDYPVKLRKSKQQQLTYQALAIENRRGQVLIQQRPDSGLLASLWTFPLFKARKAEISGDDLGDLVAETESAYQVRPILMKKPLGKVRHVFSHQIWDVILYYACLSQASQKELDLKVKKSDRLAWVYPHDLSNYAFPTVQMKLWQLYWNFLKGNGGMDS